MCVPVSPQPSPFINLRSFGNITSEGAEEIIRKSTKPLRGRFLVWYSETKLRFALSCVDSKKKIIHLALHHRFHLEKLVSKATGINQSKLCQLDPVEYYQAQILKINQKIAPKPFLLSPKVIKIILKIITENAAVGRASFLTKDQIPLLQNKTLIAFVDKKKFHLYKFLNDKKNYIDEGAEGMILMARSLRSGKLVCVKNFKSVRLVAFKDGFFHEHNLLKKIHTPKRVRGIQKPFRATVMCTLQNHQKTLSIGKFYPLKNLLDLMQKYFVEHTITCQMVCKAFLSVFKGLAKCHSLGITHNDIKLENLLCYFRKQKIFSIVIADFGLAIDFSEGNVQQVGGSPEYSPTIDLKTMEFATKKRNMQLLKSLCKKRDIFSLGSTLCIFLSGDLPYPLDSAGFPNQDEPFNRAPILNKLSEIQPGIPYPITLMICDLIEKMVNHSPIHRISLDCAIKRLRDILFLWKKIQQKTPQRS